MSAARLDAFFHGERAAFFAPLGLGSDGPGPDEGHSRTRGEGKVHRPILTMYHFGGAPYRWATPKFVVAKGSLLDGDTPGR